MSLVASHFNEHIQVAKRTCDLITDDVEKACSLFKSALNAGGKILVAGNGGSASDASHFCAELVCAYQNRNRVGLPAISMCTDPALTTAIANDFSYKKVFTRQISTLYQKGDVVLLISTSGSSSNILDALDYCIKSKIPIVLLTSTRFDRSLLSHSDSICISVPSSLTSTTQEIHIIILHIIAGFLEVSFSAL